MRKRRGIQNQPNKTGEIKIRVDIINVEKNNRGNQQNQNINDDQKPLASVTKN